MSNSKLIFNKTAKQAAQLAKDIAKSGSGELLEIPKRAPAELVGGQYNQPSPIVEAMQQIDENSGVTVKGLKNVEQINDEMTKLRRMRAEEEKKSQQEPHNDETLKLSEPGKPLLPTSPARGQKIHVAAKQTRIESKPGKD